LQNPNSFASQIKQILAARKKYGIAQATMNAVPPTGNQAVCVLAMTLPNSTSIAITALNYGRSATSIQVDLTQIPPGIPAAQLAGQTALDIISDQNAGPVSSAGTISIDLDSLAGRTLVIQRQGGTPTPPPGTGGGGGNPPPPVGSVSKTISLEKN
jgi:hypothetical protein